MLNSKIIKTVLEEEKRNRKIEKNICPACGKELSTYIYKQSHLEIEEFGYNFDEEFSEKYCKNCGWNMNKE